MTTISTNFWPAEIAERIVRTPIAVLRQAAGELSQISRGRLEGVVVPASHMEVTDDRTGEPSLSYSLFIEAPGLGRYRVGILTVVHDRTEFYPVRVESLESEQFECDDDLKLTVAIRTILQSQRVRTILISLLARLNDADS